MGLLECYNSGNTDYIKESRGGICSWQLEMTLGPLLICILLELCYSRVVLDLCTFSWFGHIIRSLIGQARKTCFWVWILMLESIYRMHLNDHVKYLFTTFEIEKFAFLQLFYNLILTLKTEFVDCWVLTWFTPKSQIVDCSALWLTSVYWLQM